MSDGKTNWTESAEVFTRPAVVGYMLDELKRAVGFRNWYTQRVLEPSCGRGAFVLVLVDRLIEEHRRNLFTWRSPRLHDFLVAADISSASIDYLKREVLKKLLAASCPRGIARKLVDKWFVCDDFLLHPFRGKFDVIVGNPPYIRFDDIPPEMQKTYQSRYRTFVDRCDIYVPFIERCLGLLSSRGAFSFICANRYTKNKYGRLLRKLIADEFHTRLYLNVEHADAFLQKVAAYPAIIVIDRKRGAPTFAGELSDIDDLPACATPSGRMLNEFPEWYSGDEPWVTTSSDALSVWREVAGRFPRIEDSAPGTKIGIGVATGADKVFLLPGDGSVVEDDCKLPVVRAEEIKPGAVSWSGGYMLNPYDSFDSRKMRDFRDYPGASAYVMQFEDVLKRRHCAKAHPAEWLRTIDRINYKVLRSPKVLMPDIQLGGVAALDEAGRYYPHHNVYYIVSDGWDMRALCTVMRSSFVAEQVKKVSVSLRGGSIRYQSQNLRGIYIPMFSDLTADERQDLASLASAKSQEKIDAAVWRTVNRILRRKKLAA